ncbi:hypothetical protein DFH09DRAFT_1087115 [Mycena vulgaris]|nr:hypothetical protein DFH09DRAFT_1087115 [Mycena vulgaris]
MSLPYWYISHLAPSPLHAADGTVFFWIESSTVHIQPDVSEMQSAAGFSIFALRSPTQGPLNVTTRKARDDRTSAVVWDDEDQATLVRDFAAPTPHTTAYRLDLSAINLDTRRIRMLELDDRRGYSMWAMYTKIARFVAYFPEGLFSTVWSNVIGKACTDSKYQRHRCAIRRHYNSKRSNHLTVT